MPLAPVTYDPSVALVASVSVIPLAAWVAGAAVAAAVAGVVGVVVTGAVVAAPPPVQAAKSAALAPSRPRRRIVRSSIWFGTSWGRDPPGHWRTIRPPSSNGSQ